jgi:hypothetical protein
VVEAAAYVRVASMALKRVLDWSAHTMPALHGSLLLSHPCPTQVLAVQQGD